MGRNGGFLDTFVNNWHQLFGLKGGGRVRVEGVGRASIQGDVRFAEALERMGADIAMGENWIEAGAGTDAASRGKLKAIDADFNHIPDAAMTAAAAALFADGTSTLRNIGSWRVKETDRIAAMASELRKLGAIVEEGADYLKITGELDVDLGELDADEIHTPGIYVDRIVKGSFEKRIEQRTVRQRENA